SLRLSEGAKSRVHRLCCHRIHGGRGDGSHSRRPDIQEGHRWGFPCRLGFGRLFLDALDTRLFLWSCYFAVMVKSSKDVTESAFVQRPTFPAWGKVSSRAVICNSPSK